MSAPPFRRLLILGLDAVPWSILRPMMECGAAPYLKSLQDAGCSGNLRSTLPHQTPAAWTTFMTGVQPGTHGVVNWERFDPRTHEFELHNAERFARKNLYHFCSRAGRRVGVVMQPATYPPFPVNGFLLSGFDGPGLDAPFAQPRDLEREILSICPEHGRNLDVDADWESEGHETDAKVFERNIGRLCAYVRRVADLALELHRRDPTDVLMVYFHAPDLLLHRAWRWCDPATAGEDPARRESCRNFFRELDRACADLARATETPGQLILALSDHGQRADAWRVRLNSILLELGFLVPAHGLGLLRGGMRRLRDRFFGIARQGLGVTVDWNRTRAFMPFQACTGFLYVNLRGRQPFGSVAPSDYEKVRDEVIAALRAYRDPRSRGSYFADAGPTDGLFKNKEQLGLPDIYVQPAPGVEFNRRAKPGANAAPTKRAYAGVHDPEGFYILNGEGVRAARDRHAHIADCAPTLLAALGLEIPSYMEGRVLSECFVAPPEPKSVTVDWDSGEAAPDAYTAEQQAQVEKRLADLGYLD